MPVSRKAAYASLPALILTRLSTSRTQIFQSCRWKRCGIISLPNGIKLAIITVPDYAGQQVLELLKSAGIKGILNFAPISLRESTDCIINNINLVTELENIIYFVNARESAKDK